MAIVPVSHDASGVVAHHQEKDHGGPLPWSAVRFGARLVAGRLEDDRAVLVLPCPVAGCGGETAHPIHDAAPALVREVAAGLATRAPEGPRPQTPEEEAEGTARTQRAARLAKLDQDIAGFGALDAAGRAAAQLNTMILVRAIIRRMLGE